MKLTEKQKRSFIMSFVSSIIVFLVLSLIQFVLMNVLKFWDKTGKLFREEEPKDESKKGSRKPTFLFSRSAAVSVFFGTFAASLLLEIPMRNYNEYINAIDRLADGDFSVRIQPNGLFYKFKATRRMADRFNNLAESLENNEVFKTDFINNFSHEFKTPIVSISGFAKLLKKGNLSEQETQEYLDIIEKESGRLASMATNVLNMTKLDNQLMLTEINHYNLSEQIRTTFLLMEKKWANRDISFDFDFDEIEVDANEELMQEVWINLLDNAIKFTPDGGYIKVTMVEQPNHTLQVQVINSGSEINPENLYRIFDKFYQEDESHAMQGNGLGLAIVQKIVTLHGGTVTAKSQDMTTCLQITLPLYK